MPRLNLTYENVLGFFTGKSPEAAATHMEFLQRDLKAAGVKVASGVRKGPKPGFKRKGKGGRPKKVVDVAAGAAAPAEGTPKVRKMKKKPGRKPKAAAPGNGAAAASAPAEVAPPVDDTAVAAGA